MKTSRNKIWKIVSLILIFAILFTLYEYYKEYQKNLASRKELEEAKIFFERTKKENIEIKKKLLADKDLLNQEKERKDKFGESLEGEKVILISKEVLDAITLPFLKE